jgi:iron complex outermembrane receptor protein
MSVKSLRFRRLLAVNILTALPLLAAAAHAQTSTETAPQTDQTPIQEVIVTAQHRSERLQSTPMSISVFTAKNMDAQGVRSIDDLARLSPGVSFQRIGATSSSNYNDENSSIAIRGIDSSAGASTTGIYVDDAPIQTRHIGFGTVNAFPALFDLNRVEVLRGPQGTLFGGGAEGGAVRFITPEPSLTTYSGSLRAEMATTEGGAPSYEVAGAVGGPLIKDKLGMRISASVRQDGGYVDRVNYDAATDTVTGLAQKNANWQRTETFRVALQWAPNANLTITPSLMYQQLTLNDTAAFWEALSDPASGKLLNGNAQRDQSKDPFYMGSVKSVWTDENVIATSIISMLERHQRTTADYTQFDRTIFIGIPYGTAGSAGTSTFQDDQRNYSAEFRLQSRDNSARLTWTTGVYLAHNRESAPQWINDPTLASEAHAYGYDYLPLNTPEIFASTPTVVTDRTAALYAQADYKLTPILTATFGLRVSDETVEANSVQSGPYVGPVDIVVDGSIHSTPVTPKFGITYQPDRDHLYYASGAKGYRAGGINPALAAACGISTPETVAEDSLWSYEVGQKSTLAGGNLVFNASLFYIKWDDIQQAVYVPACGQGFAANLGKAISQGGDFSLTYRATPNLQLALQAGYTDAHYTDDVSGEIAGLSGPGTNLISKGDLVSATPWTLNGSVEYVAPRSFVDRQLYFRADYQYAAAQDGLMAMQNTNDSSYDATIPKTPKSDNLSLRMGLKGNGLDVSFFINNALNSHAIQIVSHDTYYSPLYFQRTVRPRTFGITTTSRF